MLINDCSNQNELPIFRASIKDIEATLNGTLSNLEGECAFPYLRLCKQHLTHRILLKFVRIATASGATTCAQRSPPQQRAGDEHARSPVVAHTMHAAVHEMRT